MAIPKYSLITNSWISSADHKGSRWLPSPTVLVIILNVFSFHALSGVRVGVITNSWLCILLQSLLHEAACPLSRFHTLSCISGQSLNVFPAPEIACIVVTNISVGSNSSNAVIGGT